MRGRIKATHGHRYGYVIGGLPVAIEQPNRAQRRALAKQAKERGGRPAPKMDKSLGGSTMIQQPDEGEQP